MPRLDAPPMPPKKDRGTEMTRAQGQEMTRKVKACVIESRHENQPKIPGRTATNTAAAAKQVALMKDERIAAIASLETAKLYGLDVIKANINDVADNTTKFAVLERRMSEIIDRDSDKTDVYAIMFTIPNEPGGRAKILMTLGIFGYNMRVIRSRPLKRHNWTYYFYTEAEGDKSSLGQAMIEGLKKNCQMVKVLGHYTEVDELK